MAQWHEEALKTYTECFSIPAPNAHIVALPFVEPFSYAEAEMDIELIISAAPGLERVTTFSGISNIDPSLVYAYTAILDASLMDNTLPHVVSSSGVTCEMDFTDDEIALIEHLLMAGSAAGITCLQATGDMGFLGECGDIGANYPASSHYITGAGGTSMILTHSNQIENQTVWNDDSGISGGATSSIFPRPDWQGGGILRSGHGVGVVKS